MTDSLVGKQVNNFVIRERIGQGGMATVYLAYQPSVNREVALKIISLNKAPSERDEFRMRFAQEAKVIASLEHAHILPVYDYGIHDNEIAYIAMRLLRGGTLSDLLDKPLELSRAASIFSQIALGLSYAHRKGVIHRDLKPSNIMFDDSGFAYLSDFGLAKMVENSLDLTRSDAIVGTPTYMSPEQLRGIPLDNRTDIYSLGCVLYHMLVGYQPFGDTATGIVSVIYQQLEKAPTPPREVNPEIPPAVEAVILRALSKDREARYATAEEMSSALNQAIGSESRTLSATPAAKPTATTVSVPKPPIPTPIPNADDLILVKVPTETLPPPAAPRPSSTSPMRWLIPGVVVLVLVAAAVFALSSGILGGASPTSTAIATSVVALSTDEPTPAPTEAAASETPAPTEAPTESAAETPLATVPAELPSTEEAPLAVPLADVTGGKIAFVSNRDGNEEIYVVNSDGSNLRRLTNDPEHNEREPAWSPDGSQIIFSSYTVEGSISNYFINADGSNLRLVDAWYGWDPVWSPDGMQILFGAYGDTSGDIFVIDTDGSNRRALTNNTYDEGYPAWSPDGSQIVFAIRQEGVEDIYIMDADGSNLRALTDDQASDLMPVWSPDGTQIAFQTDRDGYSKVYLIDADGNNLRPLYEAALDSYDPSWSPDGSQIVFSSYRESSTSELYVINVDGSSVQRLTNNEADDSLPAWGR